MPRGGRIERKDDYTEIESRRWPLMTALDIVTVFTAIASALAAGGALFYGWRIAKLIGRVDTIEREFAGEVEGDPHP